MSLTGFMWHMYHVVFRELLNLQQNYGYRQYELCEQLFPLRNLQKPRTEVYTVYILKFISHTQLFKTKLEIPVKT